MMEDAAPNRQQTPNKMIGVPGLIIKKRYLIEEGQIIDVHHATEPLASFRPRAQVDDAMKKTGEVMHLVFPFQIIDVQELADEHDLHICKFC